MTKPTAQVMATDFFEKKPTKPAMKTAAGRKASGSTKPAPKKAPIKVVNSSNNKLLMDEPESVPAVPCVTVSQHAAAKAAYVELLDNNDDE